ncbi:MerR family transcriptional regulator [Catellatospora citrea]|uniref:MerR family transcriptional regulator n=1 Tax=Catellatospora citrea TaxID=53366 RepID=A0A8J3P1H5_9ACTN|nr:MerR family transcriptional regulator [Catellatospora citrea]RKE05392.1 DNA-binding transcriptional MerR regulator [Catellatospora citrea]GIG00062.1 MerR family transcriptional regulator [Catellatospora citrea]
MRIGEVAARSGVSVRALRYYEEQNLLASERSLSGQRHYPDSAVDRVRLIQHLFRAGVPSRSVAEILPCLVAGKAVTSALLDRLKAERDRIDKQIAELVATRDTLDAGIAEAAAKAAEGAPCRLV